MKPAAVFFDIDGTILPFDGVIRHLQEACRHFNVRVLTKGEILKYTIGYRVEESVPKLLPETKKFIGKFTAYYKRAYNKDVSSIRPFAYVKNVFEFIRAEGMKIGIITTKSRSQALTTLRYYKLPYDVLIGNEDVKKTKPDPEPLLKACKILRLKPEDCVMVGDHPFDMQAAKASGCMGVGVLTGWGNRKNLKTAGAKYVIRDLRGLEKIIG
jgi:pyrophosphatase PpaX